MILEKLTLHDFGVYAGCQAMPLAPVSPKKPVVLIGGLNGGGKTTLLDAIHLVLYGIRAKTSNRNGTAYPDYLRKCIHTNADAAALKLEFTQRTEGEEHAYEVHRSWVSSGREKLEIFKDGQLDEHLTKSWDEYVEEFLPLGLSRLFLFDGEKIEALADLDHSSAALTTAISSLLGLDAIDQLGADLLVVEQRKKADARQGGPHPELDVVRGRIAEHERRLTELRARRAELAAHLEKCEKRETEHRERFRKQGGDAYQRRSSFETERDGIQARIDEVKREIAEAVAGALPLAFVKELLTSVLHQDARESRATQARVLDVVLEDRDAELLAVLNAQQLPATSIALLEAHLARDRGRRVEESATDTYLSLSPEGSQQLATLLLGGLSEEQQHARKHVAQLRELEDALVRSERQLQAVPDEAAIQDVIKQHDDAKVAVGVAKEQLESLDDEISQVVARAEADKDELEQLAEKAVKEDFKLEDSGRIVQFSSRVRSTLQTFRDAVVRRHVHRIEALVLESFTQLLRKKGLVRSLHIDPSTFAVELRGDEDKVISPERLSAGERQLFAVSLLWGLARAAGRPLPAVIDTPLGRLDASHRTHLIERYFPFASHQVLLLSTDKEIDREYYEALRPFVGREYRLVFDDKRRATRVEPGYFW